MRLFVEGIRYKVIETKGNTIHHHRNMPEREGWTTATPTKFFDEVEPYE